MKTLWKYLLVTNFLIHITRIFSKPILINILFECCTISCDNITDNIFPNTYYQNIFKTFPNQYCIWMLYEKLWKYWPIIYFQTQIIRIFLLLVRINIVLPCCMMRCENICQQYISVHILSEYFYNLSRIIIVLACLNLLLGYLQ